MPAKGSDYKMQEKGIWLLSLFAVLLFNGCAKPARYILVNDRSQVIYETPNQRYICLSPAESEKTGSLMALRTMDAIQQHAQKQKADAGPVPAVLSKVLESDYTGARKLLDAQRTSLSPSLVALLDADLTYESNDQKTGTLKLVDMYQAAYDIQVCDLNRDFIQNRIRQLRYGL